MINKLTLFIYKKIALENQRNSENQGQHEPEREGKKSDFKINFG
jgi:hypothetical protein